MLVSIIMSAYNGEKHIKEQIDSVLAQTISDFELLICDDCSSDTTYTILQQYALKDSRVQIFKNPSNQGYYRTFEKLLYHCKGDYIAFCDQDDIWMPNHIELLLKAIGTKSLAFGNCILVDKDGRDLGMTVQYQEGMDTVPKNNLGWARTSFLYRNPANGMAMLFNRDILKYALPFPKISFHDIWIICLCSMLNGISYVEEPIVKYRRLDTSITGLRTTRRRKFTHVLWSYLNQDRSIVAQVILNRVPDLSLKRVSFLKRVIKMIERNNNRKGRFFNRMYLLSHYYSIFNCSPLRWK